MSAPGGARESGQSGDGIVAPFVRDPLRFSRHAARRVEDRGIPPLGVELLVRYGHVTRRHGVWRHAFDKASRRRLKAAIGKPAYVRLEDLLDAYVLVSDDKEIITAAWRLDGRRKRCVREGARLH